MERRIFYLKSESPLESLAEASFCLTPTVSLCHSKELFLEIGATQKLFGGEKGVLGKMQSLLDTFGVKGKQVLVDRPEWARACAIADNVFLPAGKTRDFLSQLPVAHLLECGSPYMGEEERKEREHLILFMQRIGIKTISDFTLLPVSAVMRRFGKGGVRLQEWASGKRDLVLPPFIPQETIREVVDTEDESSLEGLVFYMKTQLVRIEVRLRGRTLGAKQLKLTFHLDSGEKLEKRLDLADTVQESQRFLKLLQEFLPTMEWDSPLVRLEIEVSRAEPFFPGQLNLFDEGESKLQELGDYVTRLRARLGAEAVGSPELQPSYLPEKSFKFVWPPGACALSGGKGPGTWAIKQGLSEGKGPGTWAKLSEPIGEASTTPSEGATDHRPLFLLTPPKPCSPPHQWRLFPSEVLHCEWWDGEGRRQYFIAENSDRQRLWIYLDGNSARWYVHGVFD